MPWKPVRDAHAIERIQVEIGFSEQLPKKIIDRIGTELDGRLGHLRFGARQDRQVANIVIGSVGPGLAPQAQHFEGWMALRAETAGRPLEALSLDPMALLYESTDYRDWERARARIKSVCGYGFNASMEVVNASAIALDYTDRFVFEGPADQAEIESVIRSEMVAHLPDAVRSGKELWHAHRGWFETVEGVSYLVNQNLDAQQVKTSEGTDVRSLQILTKVARRSVYDAETEDLDGVLNKLHRRCNEVFASAITAWAADRVGLRA